MSKVRLIRVYLEKKYLLAFRAVMLMVAVPFFITVYKALISGSIETRSGAIETLGNGSGFYIIILEKIAFILFFIWIGTFGSAEKKATDKQDNK